MLFRDQGFNSVTVRDICDKASISIGSFYHHFASKDEIINTAHKQLDRLWELRITDHEFGNTRDDILYLFEEAGRLMHELGWELTAQSYRYILTSQKKYLMEKDRPISKNLKVVIETGLINGDFCPGTDKDELIDILIRTGRGVLFEWCLLNGEYDLPAKLRFDLTLILKNFCI